MSQERDQEWDWDALLTQSLRAGLGVAEFWALTPRETLAVLDAVAWRWEQERKRDGWLAWHIAALSRAKRLPSLRQVLGEDKARRLSGEELERRRQEHEELTRRMRPGG